MSSAYDADIMRLFQNHFNFTVKIEMLPGYRNASPTGSQSESTNLTQTGSENRCQNKDWPNNSPLSPPIGSANKSYNGCPYGTLSALMYNSHYPDQDGMMNFLQNGIIDLGNGVRTTCILRLILERGAKRQLLKVVK